MAAQPQKTNIYDFFSDNRWLFAALFVAFCLYILLPVLSPFLIAAVLAYICDPLVDKMSLCGWRQYRLGRTLATVVVMAGLLAVLVALFFIIVPLLQKESLLIAQKLPSVIDNIRAQIEPALQQHFGISLAIDPAQIQQIVTDNWKTAGGLLGDTLKLAGSKGLALIGVVANILLLPVVLFYLLRDWDGFVASVGQLVPRDWIKDTRQIAQEVDRVLAEFLRGQLTVMLALSVFYVAGLWLAGLETALPIGLIAGLLSFVPYLGITLGLTLALLAAVLQFGGLGHIIPVLLVFGLGQLLEGMVLTPILVGDRIGLHPVVVIFALLAGGQLLGFTGVLIALPLSAAIAVGLRHAKKSYLRSDAYLD